MTPYTASQCKTRSTHFCKWQDLSTRNKYRIMLAASIVLGGWQQNAFNKMMALMVHDCLNTYPDLNKPFNIYTEAFNYQLGAAIIHNGQLMIVYYSRKGTLISHCTYSKKMSTNKCESVQKLMSIQITRT